MRIALIGIALMIVGAIVPSVGYAEVNGPPGVPVLVSPGDGHKYEHGELQTFAVSAIDVDGDPYTATVTVREEGTGNVVATLSTTLAQSGGTARTVAIPPLNEGGYTWSAHATDVHGAPGYESDLRRFDVGQPAVVGGGAFVNGRVTYDPPGIPAGSCAPTSFEVRAESHAAAVDAVLAGFVGPLTVRGNGSSTCEDKFFGTGPLTVSVEGDGPTGSRIHCATLTGSFQRAGRLFKAELDGDCEITGFSAGPTRWELVANAIPLPLGAGFTTAIQESTFEGGFIVRTALQ